MWQWSCVNVKQKRGRATKENMNKDIAKGMQTGRRLGCAKARDMAQDRPG